MTEEPDSKDTGKIKESIKFKTHSKKNIKRNGKKEALNITLFTTIFHWMRSTMAGMKAIGRKKIVK